MELLLDFVCVQLDYVCRLIEHCGQDVELVAHGRGFVNDADKLRCRINGVQIFGYWIDNRTMTCRGNAPAAVADPASGVSLDVQVSVDGGTHYTPVDSAQHTVAVPCLSPTPMLPPSPPTDPPSPPSAPLSPANPPHTPAPSNPPQPPYFPMVPVPGWGKTMPGCNLGNMPSICLETTLGSSTAALRCCHSDGSCLGSICDESTRPVTGTDPDGLNVAMPDAIRECSAQGGRLCNSTEIDTCCNSGCSMDSATKLWVSDLDCAPPPVPPILPPPPPTTSA